ncbi:MAG: cell division protein FtsA [Candidatus Omnitrophica bacterium]|nr:cell division protein FtsA [Candidatus Omnitrophota bacterium]
MRMKRFIGQFFSERHFCGLDIGSEKIKACLSRVQDKDNLELLAVYESGTRGFKETSVNDISEFSSAIGLTLDALVKKTQVRFHDVYLGIGGDLVETRKSRAVIPLVERGNKLITVHDVNEARHQARLLGARLDEEVLHDFVQQFKVDDVNIALNPVGLYGRKLEVEVVLVVSNVTRLRNIGKAVKQAGFDVNNVFFNGYVLAESLLDRRQRTEGVILVDLGARTTQVLIFKEGLLKHYVRDSFGGESMTSRIAETLGIPLELAEDIKKSYARVAENKLATNNEEILIKKEQAFVPVKRALLNQAIESEVDRLISFISLAAEASGFKDQLKSGVVMVGGGALLPGLLERVEVSLAMPVILGRSISGLNNAATFCAATSVAESGYKGTMRYVFDTRKPKDWIEHFRQKAEELCNEYF